jgi:hypothetical protein
MLCQAVIDRYQFAIGTQRFRHPFRAKAEFIIANIDDPI